MYENAEFAYVGQRETLGLAGARLPFHQPLFRPANAAVQQQRKHRIHIKPAVSLQDQLRLRMPPDNPCG